MHHEHYVIHVKLCNDVIHINLVNLSIEQDLLNQPIQTCFRFKQDQALVSLIQNPVSALYVVKTDANVSCPFSLLTRSEFTVSRLLPGRSLREVDIGSLTVNDLNPHVLRTLTVMCNAPVRYLNVGFFYMWSKE